MTNPTAAMIVIGDEILSGRTRDSNAHHLAGRLAIQGIDLREVRFIGDDRRTIVATVQDLSAQRDHVFTSGGIGPTHDDITADCVAEAMGAGIDVRDDARAILQAYYDAREIEMNAARLRMARIPDGAALIDNPVSAAPGFSIGNVHVMAGVPRIFEAMLDGLLRQIEGGRQVVSRSFLLDRGEGDIADVLRQLATDHSAVSIGSYPAWTGAGYQVAVVLRGAEAGDLDAVAAELRAAFPEARE
ncbi:molybdenum cofactor synthesis domain-containing protein [Palleronia marisminoris]|uniref:Nicotinamide-nucleotide amidohydrolase PncC n=1 Tax=Palleronia marisminoris TaxID=315423 RepID=A0A1Y5SZS8_9RHOB|nr:molybdopterin-binding protein [Palleronia marisminoris]SFH09199.1 molybdenum cofactor synthesis domain-containing protein [Palleronia marisminoris]SLN52464.1 Nicotinamide-nucleotide amidohydrolase PncC [Palleronia marisminoris]